MARLCLAAVVVLALLSSPTSATRYVVTSVADSGSGSLRDAIDKANAHAGPDSVCFQASLYHATIQPTSASPAVAARPDAMEPRRA